MKKNIEQYIQTLIEKNEDSKEAYDILYKKLIRKSLIYFLVFLIMIIISFVQLDKVKILSRIANGLAISKLFTGLSFEKVYLFILIIGSSFVLLVSLVSLFFKYEQKRTNKNILKGLYRAYGITDFISFIFMTIISLTFIMMFIATPCCVDGSSMNNTYNDGDRVVIYHVNYNAKRDDAVVFDASNPEYGVFDAFFIKRIKALPGDELKYKVTNSFSGELLVNDVKIETVYLDEFKKLITSIDYEYNSSSKYIVPEGRYMVLGDNRVDSTDSRRIGFIYKKDLVGKVVFRFFPFNSIGLPKENDNYEKR